LFIIKVLFLPLLAYLLGSIPWGLVLTRLFSSVDIRKVGSGNIGATNVRRAVGSPLALVVFTGDFFKGALPVWMANRLLENTGLWSEIYIAVVALLAFLGHLYPLYLKGKEGGKGVATAAGCFLSISPWALVVSLLTFVLFICLCNRVSAASLAASAVLPLAVWYASGVWAWTGCALIMAVCMYVRHKDNIIRLLTGREPVIWKPN
jgi:glycerol-3-phosphate acyltransferase PlsY